jgi:hypothetical protein
LPSDEGSIVEQAKYTLKKAGKPTGKKLSRTKHSLSRQKTDFWRR